MPDHAANSARQRNAFAALERDLPGFYRPTGAEKKQLLELLGVSKRFAQTFDAIRLHVPRFADVASARDFDLLELKCTDAHLPRL